MEALDINKHVFKGNERGEGYLSFLTVLCILFIGFLGYLIIHMYPAVLTMQYIGISVVLVCLMICIVITLVSAWAGYNYALDTTVQIDPLSRHFVYTHRGKTIEFNGDDVQAWYDNIGLKIGVGKLTRLTDHDSVLILSSGEVIYLHAWLWDGDYSWLHAGDSWEHNIKFYLEAHHCQLDLPECTTAWTYKYMFANTQCN